MAYALFDSSLAFGGTGFGGKPLILETTGCIIMNLLPDVKYHRKAGSLKDFLT